MRLKGFEEEDESNVWTFLIIFASVGVIAYAMVAILT